MSISDLIVVMKKGVLQQIDAPQRVYDNPANLFVAKFLGTPPINVFKGCIKSKYVYIGEEKLMKVNLPDQDLHIGIRPEGFIVSEKGKLSLDLANIEVMGRDSSLVCDHQDAESDIIRAIIDADVPVNPVDGKVKVNIKPNKIFLFKYDTEERIYLEGEEA
jgi:multiple sugar transport system ATP-binding protein